MALGGWQETEARALGARKAKQLGLGRGRAGSRLGLSEPEDSECMRVNAWERKALCSGFTSRVRAGGGRWRQWALNKEVARPLLQSS